MKVDLFIIDFFYCASIYNKCPKYKDEVNDNMICTNTKGKNVCPGDRGGPLNYNLGKQTYLLGVASWGLECEGKHPGVWTNVPRYSDWIWETINKHS